DEPAAPAALIARIGGRRSPTAGELNARDQAGPLGAPGRIDMTGNLDQATSGGRNCDGQATAGQRWLVRLGNEPNLNQTGLECGGFAREFIFSSLSEAGRGRDAAHTGAALIESPDERQRLAALQRYQVLDTPPEPAFDDIAELARTL